MLCRPCRTIAVPTQFRRQRQESSGFNLYEPQKTTKGSLWTAISRRGMPTCVVCGSSRPLFASNGALLRSALRVRDRRLLPESRRLSNWRKRA